MVANAIGVIFAIRKLKDGVSMASRLREEADMTKMLTWNIHALAVLMAAMEHSNYQRTDFAGVE